MKTVKKTIVVASLVGLGVFLKSQADKRNLDKQVKALIDNNPLLF